jgi:nucleotide-binding universal stress UspA family protein
MTDWSPCGSEVVAGGSGRTTPTVVVGFDGSASSEHAMAYAAGVSRRTGGSLLVAYVVSISPTVGLTSLGTEAVSAWPVDDGVWMRRLAEEVLHGTGIRWRFTTGCGDVAAVLAQVGHDHHADALVVGRSRVPARHVLGSVPARLARRARCPVTVVP